jgi:hypothetical protein
LLNDKLTPNAIRAALRNFCKHGRGSENDGDATQALAYAYDQLMKRINEQGPSTKKLAQKVLSYLTYAKRQLTTLELQHAVAT